MKNYNKQDYEILRHSCAHLLAKAVKTIWPGTHNAIGPAIENGFYQDFDFGEVKISESDFPKIEKLMREILKKWDHFTYREVTVEEAKELFKDNPYKVELINEFAGQGKKLTVNDPGEFLDLCKMTHVENPSSDMQYFKLLSVAGAYWRGDEKNKMLTRIYGTAFFSQKDLEQYLWQIDEAKKRDHRKLGRELNLFTFSDLVGAGMPLYTPKGTALRLAITNFVEEIQSSQDYTQVWTPQIGKAELYKMSGHYDKYKEDMFRVVSNYSKEEFYLKPMNCPHAAEIYKSQKRSYRDLPLRFTDFAMLYRDEKPGELNGLARVRAFSQDDCHVYCREDQVDSEVDMMLAMTKQIMTTFGFKYRYRLSTRDPAHPEKYLGDPKEWDKVEAWAVKIMERNGIDYYDGPGEAAFYAPKMDLMATDALGREWQLSTVQIDYVQPRRFDLTYTDKNGTEVRPVTIHRAIAGSPERLMMVLIEHYAGVFPLWLSPVQVKLLPISEKELAYTQELTSILKKAGLRVESDDTNNTLGKKIVRAREDKVPYFAVIGSKEAGSRTLTLKTRAGEQQTLSPDEVVAKLLQESASRA